MTGELETIMPLTHPDKRVWYEKWPSKGHQDLTTVVQKHVGILYSQTETDEYLKTWALKQLKMGRFRRWWTRWFPIYIHIQVGGQK